MWSVLAIWQRSSMKFVYQAYKRWPKGAVIKGVDQSHALLSEGGRGEKGFGYCEILRNLAQPQARHLQHPWQAWTTAQLTMSIRRRVGLSDHRHQPRHTCTSTYRNLQRNGWEESFAKSFGPHFWFTDMRNHVFHNVIASTKFDNFGLMVDICESHIS